MLYWLSFAEPGRTLGVAIVEPSGPAFAMADAWRLERAGTPFRDETGRGVGAAIMEAHLRRINPGGEVQGSALPPEPEIGEQWRNRLLTKAEAMELNALLDSQTEAREPSEPQALPPASRHGGQKSGTKTSR